MSTLKLETPGSVKREFEHNLTFSSTTSKFYQYKEAYKSQQFLPVI